MRFMVTLHLLLNLFNNAFPFLERRAGVAVEVKPKNEASDLLCNDCVLRVTICHLPQF